MERAKPVWVVLDIAVWNENIYTHLLRYEFPNLAAAKRFARGNLSAIIPHIYIVEEDGVILKVYNYI